MQLKKNKKSKQTATHVGSNGIINWTASAGSLTLNQRLTVHQFENTGPSDGL